MMFYWPSGGIAPFSSVLASLVTPPTAMASTIGEVLLPEALCLRGASP